MPLARVLSSAPTRRTLYPSPTGPSPASPATRRPYLRRDSSYPRSVPARCEPMRATGHSGVTDKPSAIALITPDAILSCWSLINVLPPSQ
ncbi:hypothetical protein B0H12DRAFT_1112551 [Mycena haematopus]|nr:hypothetical protein B0H12DRAFT_1112551 [Mycena haematopus]